MENRSPTVPETKICRICANLVNFFYSIDSKFENISYAVIVQVICPVKVETNDTLPKCVCFDCADILLRAYKLRDICMNNDRKFRSSSKTYNVSETITSVKAEIVIYDSEDENNNDDKQDETTYENLEPIKNPTSNSEIQQVSLKRKGESLIKKTNKVARKKANEDERMQLTHFKIEIDTEDTNGGCPSDWSPD